MTDKVLNDRYQIKGLIGKGGMAYVYKALDLKLNREVAVKVLREEYTENEQFIKKFDRESQAAAGLTHPNIVSVYDVGVEDNIYYIIMEYVDGITLKQYLNKKGSLDYYEATQFILEIAGALKCAHEHKIIHRDIKPHNILLTKELTPKVADFGIARAITSSTVTVTNQTMGSVHYISPEQARGGFVDECSDLYSLGIMYYELLTGQLPFDAESSVSIAIKHIQEPLTPPKELNYAIPESVNEVVVKLTQKKPEDRYQNMQELIDDLDLLLDNFDVDLPNSKVQTAPLDSFGTDLFTIEDDSGPISNLQTDVVVKPTRDYRGWVIFTIVFLILLLAAGLFTANSVMNRQIVVPNVSGMALEEAIKTIENVGLKPVVEKETYHSSVPSGSVISQDPAGGTNVREGSEIALTVSQGLESILVPNVIGKTEEVASSQLTESGFNVDVEREYNSNYENGSVFNMNPEPGTKLYQGQTVTLYVSMGVDNITVPGIVGLTQSDAESRLTGSGLNVGTVTQQTSTSYAAGMVISQSPAEGTRVERGTYISYVVSTGPPSSSGLNQPTVDNEEEVLDTENNSSGSGGSGSNNSSGSGGSNNTNTNNNTYNSNTGTSDVTRSSPSD